MIIKKTYFDGDYVDIARFEKNRHGLLVLRVKEWEKSICRTHSVILLDKQDLIKIKKWIEKQLSE
jgi:hypothetical protein